MIKERSVAPEGVLTLGALGGEATFGAQAARGIVDLYPEFGKVVYLENSAEAFGETGEWRTDASCVPEQTSKTGFHVTTQRRLVAASGAMHVLADISHSYHCALLTKPGAGVDGVRRVLGHTGSINQSRSWLNRNLPQATVEVIDSHSLGAGLAVVDGDGSIAAVGTPELAAELGLEEAASDIDEGSVGHYWAVSPRKLWAPEANTVVLAGESYGADEVSTMVTRAAVLGMRMRTIWMEAVGDQLYHNWVVAIFVGEVKSSEVSHIVDGFGQKLWIAGAFWSQRVPS